MRFKVHIYIWKYVYDCMLSCVQLFATSWSVARQAPLFMEFQTTILSAFPFLPPGDFPQKSAILFLQLLHCRQILYH